MRKGREALQEILSTQTKILITSGWARLVSQGKPHMLLMPLSMSIGEKNLSEFILKDIFFGLFYQYLIPPGNVIKLRKQGHKVHEEDTKSTKEFKKTSCPLCSFVSFVALLPLT
jgi:hypothetical protein